jgi:hypothetical protein
LNHTLYGISLHDDAILAQLLLNKDDLFRAFDDEIPTRIEWAFAHMSELSLGPTCKDTLVAPEHDGKTAYVHI